MYEIDWKFPLCYILGNEVSGVSEDLSAMADIHVELPMRGIKQSLNVSVAAGVVGYEFARHYIKHKKPE
jgi:tRNA G18 (ribose-2'-O)-methylase SpoU